MLLAAAAATCICGHVYAGARLGSDALFSISVFDAKTSVGQDGLLRVLFDYNPAHSPGPSTYSGSALWILDPNGGLVAAGNTTIPATVGATFLTTDLLDRTVFNYELSNTAILAQASGNTTVLFYYGLAAGKFANSFGLWTYNKNGVLIGAAQYGPFGSTVLGAMYFDPSGKIIARWQTGHPPNATKVAGWVLDEFGTISSATNYFGPFGPNLGKICLNSSGQQIWPYKFLQPDGTYTTVIWTFNASGSALAHAQVYGPF
jgi:hypothetical protein